MKSLSSAMSALGSKKILSSLAVLFCLSVVLFGCEKEQPPVAFLRLSAQEATLTAEKPSQEIKVLSNTAWVISADKMEKQKDSKAIVVDKWLNVSVGAAAGSGTLTVSLVKPVPTENKTATLDFVSGNLKQTLKVTFTKK